MSICILYVYICMNTHICIYTYRYIIYIYVQWGHHQPPSLSFSIPHTATEWYLTLLPNAQTQLEKYQHTSEVFSLQLKCTHRSFACLPEPHFRLLVSQNDWLPADLDWRTFHAWGSPKLPRLNLGAAQECRVCLGEDWILKEYHSIIILAERWSKSLQEQENTCKCTWALHMPRLPRTVRSRDPLHTCTDTYKPSHVYNTGIAYLYIIIWYSVVVWWNVLIHHHVMIYTS